MKRKSFITTFFAAAALLAACGQGGGAHENAEIVTEITEPVEITFWHGMSGVPGDALAELTDRFEKDHPNIKVNLQNQGSYTDLQSKLTTTMQSPKDLPTLTQAYPDWLLGPIEDGDIVDLKPYIEHDQLKFNDYQDVIEGLRDGVAFDGKIYGIPFNKSTEVLWYNKDILDEVGAKIPTTFEELKEVSQLVYAKKGIPGVGFDSLPNFYVTYLKNKGVEFDSRLDVTGPESEEAVKFYDEGVKEGYFRIAGTDNYMSGPFGNQQAAMYIGSNAGESFVKEGAEGKFEYGVAPYPAKFALQQGTDLYMFQQASPEQRTAAFEYMKFLTESDSQMEWATATGYMPVRTGVINDPAYIGSGSHVAGILKDVQDLFSYPKEIGIGQAYNDVRPMMETILTKKDANIQDELGRFHSTFQANFD